MSTEVHCDVAIVGGGPAGATAGSLLKKYRPELQVSIFEREWFPRDHVGESHLPPISKVLDEMGCWDKVESANFPIKIGATYRWGRRPELWHFDFLPFEVFIDEPRPAKFDGQRLATAFQVDRSVYDKILLDHAQEMGCDVHQGSRVVEIKTDGDHIAGLRLESGDLVKARHYIDASGTSGILRRALKVPSEYPSTLKNVAIWDYWQNADWAVSIGVGGTRIQILTVGYGWIWFIPLGPTRTSIGLVVPAEYLKHTGMKPEDLYIQALSEESIITDLVKNAKRESNLQTTRDWSYIAERQAGDNWFLAGESSGFADPILSAGMTMAHLAGRDAAYTILELDQGTLDKEWLLEEYANRQSQRIRTHIRFADYWYTSNGQFTELKEFTSEIARNAGLDLSPDKAWAWIAQGGFIDEDLGFGTGGFSLSFLQQSGDFLSELSADSPLLNSNVFKLNLSGASWKDRAAYRNGRVAKEACYTRDGRVLPIGGVFEYIVYLLQQASNSSDLLALVRRDAAARGDDSAFIGRAKLVPQALEAMILDGWVTASFDPSQPLLSKRGSVSEVLRWDKEPHASLIAKV